MGHVLICKKFVARHYLALLCAVVVGVVAVLPQILAIQALGNNYKGIHLFYPDDNTYYMARMQDILDGHGLISSPFIYEYKNQRPLMYPLGEYIYAFPSIFFGVPLVTTLIADKLFFPFVLFLIVYGLIYLLTGKPKNISGKINAIAGGLLVTLGYNLIDYKNTLQTFFYGVQSLPLLWTRPVNPITGAILIFLFLMLLWSHVCQRRKLTLIASGVVFSLMVGYFFTWSLSLSIIFVLSVIFFLTKKYLLLKDLFFIVVTGFLISFPYWYNVGQFLVRPNKEEIALRNGMLITHEPLFNKVVLLTACFFFLCFFLEYRAKRKKRESMESWWWFSTAIIIGSLVALNQQTITGKAIWPYHFVQYTTPLAFVVIMTIFFNYIRPRAQKLWSVGITGILLVTLLYGFLTVKSYAYEMEKFQSTQRYADILSWFRHKAEKDCVVLVREGLEERLIRLIPSFTSCNVYNTQWILFGVVSDNTRIYHNFFTTLRINDVKPEGLKDYLHDNASAVNDYFFHDWLDYKKSNMSAYVAERNNRIVSDYKDFFKKDFMEELENYRIDYIASDGVDIFASFPKLKPVGFFNGIYLYML